VFRDETDLETLAKRAMRTPSFESAFRNLYLNQRVDAVERAINRADWEACAARVELDDLKGLKCFGGLDLGSTSDLCAITLYWPEVCASAGPGNGCRGSGSGNGSRLTACLTTLGSARAASSRRRDGPATMLRSSASCCGPARVQRRFDRLRPLADRGSGQELEDEGLGDVAAKLSPFGQGFKEMAPAFDEFETLLIDRKLRHGGSPVLRWQASNLIVQRDEAGNRKPDKRRSFDKIDGIVSLIMAVGVAMGAKETVPVASPWDDPSFTLVAA
jgi:phage terminase large subunit-like protein